ncbi:MAG TPA: DMT family transporter [Tepidisphaeraceae bacterium]|nr:DMT family transporter [Tepidisphaeraceae bacterium]
MNLFLAIVGVIGVSASGPIMAATAAPALAIAFWRNAIGAIATAAPTLVAHRGRIRDISWSELKWSAAAALALALHFACFITAVKLTSVAAATALVCLQAAWIALFQFLGGNHPSRAMIAGMALALVGVVVITGLDLEISSAAVAGDGLALAGGAFAAIYTMAGGRVRRTLSTGIYTMICYGICALVLMALCVIFSEPVVGFSPLAWWGILGVTVLAQFLGHTIFNHLLARLSPLVVSMIILLEIPGAALMAAVFLGQYLPNGTYLGLLLILGGLAVVVFWQGRTGQRVVKLPGAEDEQVAQRLKT